MAIGNAYRRNLDIKDNDVFLGTRAENRQTVNFTAQSIADYLNTKGKISIAGQMAFKFVTSTALQGTISFEEYGGNGRPFSEITRFRIANKDLSDQRVVEFIEYLVGTDILVAEQKELSFFGHYKITGYTNDELAGFHILHVEYLGGSGNIVMNAVYDVAVFNPFPTDDKNSVFVQSVPTATWEITHNLEKYPSVTVVNSNNITMYGQVTYINENQLRIEFSGGFSGKAYMN